MYSLGAGEEQGQEGALPGGHCHRAQGAGGAGGEGGQARAGGGEGGEGELQ